VGIDWEENRKRGKKAKLGLCRRPGLRILGVDLGQRYAAACAVWETLTLEEMRLACEGARSSQPTADCMSLVLEESGKKIHFRRIGPNVLQDGSQHPAPWAKLGRQFLVKLQGEDRATRGLNADEKERVGEFLARLGMPGEAMPHRVDEAMENALRLARWHLADAGRLAKLAHSLQIGECRRAGLLWLQLAQKENGIGEWAKAQWGACLEMTAPKRAAGRGKRGNGDEEAAANAAEAFLAGNEAARAELHVNCVSEWTRQVGIGRENLRWLRRWLIPRGGEGRKMRRVGGLSMRRINNLSGLYGLEKAWKQKPEASDPRANVPVEGSEEDRNFCARILQVREELRKNRVRQTASRILEAALGLGREPERDGGGRARKRDKEPPDGKRFGKCDAIVIENLSGYGTSETRLRRENRALMNWSKAKIKDALREGCELNGLLLREVIANYTSRQDSRTGAPGMRCIGVALEDLAAGRKVKYARLRERITRGTKDATGAEKEYFDVILAELSTGAGGLNGARDVLIPQNGGDLFVSCGAEHPAAGTPQTRTSGSAQAAGREATPGVRTLQADLNAAGNIGLRELLDPDWAGRWWYVPVDAQTRRVSRDDFKGCGAEGLREVGNTAQPRAQERSVGRAGRAATKERPKVNLWRDPAAETLAGEKWTGTVEYWAEVRNRLFRDVLLPRLKQGHG
jgi:hypothetical protein